MKRALSEFHLTKKKQITKTDESNYHDFTDRFPYQRL